MRTPQTVEAWRRRARRRLPHAIFDTIEGGAGDETALNRNRQALTEVEIVPRVLAGAGPTTASVLGGLLPAPLVVAPTGMSGFYWPHGERAMAGAASRLGVPYVLSAVSSVSLEEIAAVGGSGLWFQLYPLRRRDITSDLIRRAREARYGALVVTVDVPVIGRRERDLNNGVRLPPRLDAGLAASMVMKPGWTLPYALGYRPSLANLAPYDLDWRGLKAPELDAAFGWADLKHVRDAWPGPLLVKGVMHPDDARRALDEGADAVVVSNHGGRQLDAAPATATALKEIRAALPDAKLLVDGGVRRGSDILRFQSIGADACLAGRAPLYGLAAAGEAGAMSVLQILIAEHADAVRLVGASQAGRTPSGKRA